MMFQNLQVRRGLAAALTVLLLAGVHPPHFLSSSR